MSYSVIEPYMTNRTKAKNKVKPVTMTMSNPSRQKAITGAEQLDFQDEYNTWQSQKNIANIQHNDRVAKGNQSSAAANALNQSINNTLNSFDPPPPVSDPVGKFKDWSNQSSRYANYFNQGIAGATHNPLGFLLDKQQRDWSNKSSAAGQNLNDVINALTGSPAQALATAASNMAPNTNNPNLGFENSEDEFVPENTNVPEFVPIGELPGTKSFGTGAAFDKRLQLMDLLAKLGLQGDRATQDYVRRLGRIDRAQDKGISAIEDAMQRRGMTNSGVRDTGMGEFLGEVLRSRGDLTNQTSRKLQDLLLQQGLVAEQDTQRFVDRDALKSFLNSVATSANIRGV
tara:strand:+ start:1375 stop:2403 length:1029 start_codon:yes stop_codon:yes gene_type:complete